MLNFQALLTNKAMLVFFYRDGLTVGHIIWFFHMIVDTELVNSEINI